MNDYDSDHSSRLSSIFFSSSSSDSPPPPKDPSLVLHDYLRTGAPLSLFKKALSPHTAVALDSQAQTPLHVAAGAGLAEHVGVLLRKKYTDVNAQSKNGWTPLHVAANRAQWQIVKMLLDHPAIHAGALNDDDVGVLHYLVRQDISRADKGAYESILRRAEEKGCSWYVQNLNGECPLHSAALKGNLIAVDYALRSGILTDLRNRRGETPLYYSIMVGKMEVTALLLEFGANRFALTKARMSGLHLAREVGILELMDVIGYSKVGYSNDAQESELMCAARAGDLSVVRQLIDVEGVNPNAFDKYRMTPLLHAASMAQFGVVAYLVSVAAVDCNVANDLGYGVLHFLACFSSAETPSDTALYYSTLRALIKERGCNPNMFTTKMETPLHYAALCANAQATSHLIELGADASKITLFNESPMSYAVYSNSLAIVTILLSHSNALHTVDLKNLAGFSPLQVAQMTHQSSIQNIFASILSQQQQQLQHSLSMQFATTSSIVMDSNSMNNNSNHSTPNLNPNNPNTNPNNNLNNNNNNSLMYNPSSPKLTDSTSLKSTDSPSSERHKVNVFTRASRLLQRNKQATSADMTIGAPTGLVHRTHVDAEMNWKAAGANADQHAAMWHLDRKLGEGAHGAVYRGVHKETGFEAAIKTYKLTNKMDDILREVDILRKCSHPNIVAYLGCHKQADETLWVLMDFCRGGAVYDILQKRQAGLSERQIAAICLPVLHGLAYLHDRGVIHRDLKAANILLSAEGNPKIADFGVSAQLSSDDEKARTAGVGTPLWMSPEILEGAEHDERADIWSLGITTYEMAEVYPPHYRENLMRAMFLISTSPPPTLPNAARWSSEFLTFFNACLQRNPANRPTSLKLLQFPFLAMSHDECETINRQLIEEIYATSKNNNNNNNNNLNHKNNNNNNNNNQEKDKESNYNTAKKRHAKSPSDPSKATPSLSSESQQKPPLKPRKRILPLRQASDANQPQTYAEVQKERDDLQAERDQLLRSCAESAILIESLQAQVKTLQEQLEAQKKLNRVVS